LGFEIIARKVLKRTRRKSLLGPDIFFSTLFSDWIELVEDTDGWQAFMDAVMNFWVP
jgi:hypothetical protein